MRAAAALFVVAMVFAAPDAGAASRAHIDYALHCQGCHTAEGVSPPLGRIPPLKDAVGHFTRIPEGRLYLVNVPGVVNAGLSAEATASLLNWLVDIYAGPTRPDPFVPFTGAEVEKLRGEAPDDVMRLRQKVRTILAGRGLAIEAYP